MEYKELKPCPFCGGSAVEADCNVTKEAWVECIECKASSARIKISLDYCAKDKAFEFWNKRVTDDEKN